MKKEEFIYLWVHMCLRMSIQATIAIESYYVGTIPNFYEDLHQAFDKALVAYDNISTKSIEPTKMQALLLAYLTGCRNEQIELALDQLEQIIDSRSFTSTYDVKERFREYSGRKSKNPFLDIIKEIRNLEEK